MPSTCVVPFCSARIGGHKFPRDRKLREKWIEAIRRVNFVPSEYSIVCKNHFKKEDYRVPKESLLDNPAAVLKKDSIPSQFSWNEQGSSSHKRKNEKKNHLSQRCSVLQCKSGSGKNIILHSCPSQESTRKKWSEVFKVNREVVKNMLICSQHFLKTDYLSSKKGESWVLKQSAVPSQRLPRSTRVLSRRNKVVYSKKKLIRPKNIKKEPKMTESKDEDIKPTLDEEIIECRTCMKKIESKSNTCNIFQSWAPPWDGMEATIAEDLSKLANVEITSVDKHSKVICEPCYNKLLEAATFASKVRHCNEILKERERNDIDKVWPQPIQVDKNINGNVYQEMDIDIKQEVISDEEYEQILPHSPYITDTAYVEQQQVGDVEIKSEPVDYEEPPPLSITINGTISLHPSNTESKTLINGEQEYDVIINHGMEDNILTNGVEDNHEEQYSEANIKQEPLSDEENLEEAELSLECMLCMKIFNSVTGLKAHVIAQHSYKSVKRKGSNCNSPEKKQKIDYRCQICKRSFTTSTDLMVHETCHNKHSCYQCSRKFDTFKQLTNHRKRCRVPISNTVVKPKTLDDVIRPIKEESLESKLLTDLNSSDDVKLHLKIHSSETDLKQMIVSDIDKQQNEMKEDCT